MSVRLPVTDAPTFCPVCYNNTLTEDEELCCGERVFWCSSCTSMVLEQDIIEAHTYPRKREAPATGDIQVDVPKISVSVEIGECNE